MKTLVILFALSGCAHVTPENRAKAYALYAEDFRIKCKAYRFDRGAVLVEDVSAMTELCQ